jgi:hypothetical protein
MLVDPTQRDIAARVAAMVHKEQRREAAKFIVEVCRLPVKITDDDPRHVMPVLQHYLHYLLNSGGMEEAAQLLWTPTQFSPSPKSVKDIWGMFDESSNGLIMGAASMSKSYSFGVRLMLEWIRDPEWTAVRVVGPSEAHLEQNLFSHLVALHRDAKLPMPGEVGDLYIGMDRRNQVSAIRGVVIPIGSNKKSGRLQGTKRKPRKAPHPVFGPLSRLFIFIDEIENVPQGLWKDIDNILSQVEDEGAGKATFKLFGAYNPSDQSNEVAKRAEPTFGWENFDVDQHFRWKSTRGWDVLRLDGERCENVLEGKTVYPGLQTQAGLKKIAENGGGRQSAGYFTQGRGAYPPQGVELTVVPPGMFMKWRGEFIWHEEPIRVAALDTALEGGAAASYSLGSWGRASGKKLPPTIENPNGVTIMFKDKLGNVQPRWGLQLDQQFPLMKGDTIVTKDETIRINRHSAVRPEFFALDRTGNGAGVADLIRYEWSSAIHEINFSESPSEGKKIMLEDSKTCDEDYDRMCSELWFALRAYGEFGYLLIHPSVDISKLQQQVTQRRFRAGAKRRVESKKDYMSRGFASPDEADSLTLLVMAARRGAASTLSMRGVDVEANDGYDDWFEVGRDVNNGVYIDPSNRADYLGGE